jgi:hypothetical protein
MRIQRLIGSSTHLNHESSWRLHVKAIGMTGIPGRWYIKAILFQAAIQFIALSLLSIKKPT